MLKRLLALKGSFAYESGFLVIATIIGNILGWAYHIFVARTLGVETFGLFGALIGIFYVATLGGGAFRIEIAAIIARLTAQGDENAAVATFIKMGLRFFLIFPRNRQPSCCTASTYTRGRPNRSGRWNPMNPQHSSLISIAGKRSGSSLAWTRTTPSTS